MQPSVTHLSALFEREVLNRTMLQYGHCRILTGFQQFRYEQDGQNPSLPELLAILK